MALNNLVSLSGWPYSGQGIGSEIQMFLPNFLAAEGLSYDKLKPSHF